MWLIYVIKNVVNFQKKNCYYIHLSMLFKKEILFVTHIQLYIKECVYPDKKMFYLVKFYTFEVSLLLMMDHTRSVRQIDYKNNMFSNNQDRRC